MNLPTATRDHLQYKQKMQQQYKHKQEKGKNILYIQSQILTVN